MAVYECDECGQFLDDDYHPAAPHPKYISGIICPECLLELEELEDE